MRKLMITNIFLILSFISFGQVGKNKKAIKSIMRYQFNNLISVSEYDKKGNEIFKKENTYACLYCSEKIATKVQTYLYNDSNRQIREIIAHQNGRFEIYLEKEISRNTYITYLITGSYDDWENNILDTIKNRTALEDFATIKTALLNPNNKKVTHIGIENNKGDLVHKIGFDEKEDTVVNNKFTYKYENGKQVYVGRTQDSLIFWEYHTQYDKKHRKKSELHIKSELRFNYSIPSNLIDTFSSIQGLDKYATKSRQIDTVQIDYLHGKNDQLAEKTTVENDISYKETYFYNKKGQLTEKQYLENNELLSVTTYSYDSYGNIIKEICHYVKNEGKSFINYVYEYFEDD